MSCDILRVGERTTAGFASNNGGNVKMWRNNCDVIWYNIYNNISLWYEYEETNGMSENPIGAKPITIMRENFEKFINE